MGAVKTSREGGLRQMSVVGGAVRVKVVGSGEGGVGVVGLV